MRNCCVKTSLERRFRLIQQAYEITLKKMGDLTSQRKRLLKCQMRICFHERRLQYMELEQISEWSLKHPAERILDIDLPLSYGIVDPVRDPCNLNVVNFKWDPTRDTGVYVKVNCISTEFTPKKHGGEKGVPFRLQVRIVYQGAFGETECNLGIFPPLGSLPVL